MPKSIAVKPKKRGRPATGKDPFIGIRLPPSLIREIENWAEENDAPSRSEAIRRLLETGLQNARGTSTRSSKRAAAKASHMAASTLEQLGDKSAPAEERSKRKRRLLEGQSEFREMRADLPKLKR